MGLHSGGKIRPIVGFFFGCECGVSLWTLRPLPSSRKKPHTDSSVDVGIRCGLDLHEKRCGLDLHKKPHTHAGFGVGLLPGGWQGTAGAYRKLWEREVRLPSFLKKNQDFFLFFLFFLFFVSFVFFFIFSFFLCDALGRTG